MIKKRVWKINKTVLPQHSDHAGVMWHGTYFNWLEEGRINALAKAGINYLELTKYGFELPLVNASIKYIQPIYLGDEILIESIFNITKSPRINIHSKLINETKKVTTVADINIVLVDKKNFSIIRKRPDFILKAFLKLTNNSFIG